MLSSDDIKAKLSSYFAENFPDENESYSLNVVSQDIINTESDFIKRVVLDFQLSFNSDKYDCVSNLFISCEQLAEVFCENVLLAELKDIWVGHKRGGMSIPDLEYLIIKGIKGSSGLKKEFMVEDQIYSVGGLSHLLKNNKRDIYRIFGKIQKTYNIAPAEFDWSAQINKKDANVGFDDLNI